MKPDLLAKHIFSIQVLCDLFSISLAWIIAFYIRFIFLSNGQGGRDQTFLFWFVPLATITLYFLMRSGLYDRKQHASYAADALQVMRANAIAALFFVFILYFTSESRISRLTIIMYIFISTFLLLMGRALIRSGMRKLRRRGFLLKNVLFIGNQSPLNRYLATVNHAPTSGIRVVAQIAKDKVEKTMSLDEIEALIKEYRAEIVVLGFQDEGAPFVGEFIEKFYDALFTIQVLSAEKRVLLGLVTEEMGDLKLLSLNQPSFNVAELISKRLVDIVGSAFGLCLFAPFFVLIGIAIKMSSAGPVFYSQHRIGINGRKFLMWKFRTMRPAAGVAPAAGWTIENDPRRTKFGTFLRRTSIDELPQLWNVLCGEMSLVGPRPEQPFFVDQFKTAIPAYMLRHKMKVGITGWAQINGWRGDTSLEKRIEYDLSYIRNWTLWFDIKILIMTFAKGFINKNAY